jgi:pimeloyl-ACP methyl ester carboxylesterase
MKKMLHALTALIALSTVPVVARVHSPTAFLSTQIPNEDVAGRGRLIRSDFLLALSRNEVAQGLTTIGWSDVVVNSGVALYRIIYTTVDAHGASTTASGLMALPTDLDPVGVVSFGHGTNSLKSYVPSAPTLEGEAVAGLFASGGFAVVAPDYVGLGQSSGPHPYLHANSEASASLDLLTAAHRAARAASVAFPSLVFLTGFSQGGQTALALDEMIETASESPWQVVAVAPIAGPYDLSGTEFPGMIDGAAQNNSAYAAYLALSYIQTYGIVSTADVFLPPYDQRVPLLFDGQNAFDEIAKALPAPRALFRPEFLAAVSQGTHPFAWQLRHNDTLLVTTRAEVRLYFGGGDVDVSPRNAQLAAVAMRSVGVRATAIDLGPDVDHPLSEQFGLPAVRGWFDQLVAHQ